VKVNKISGTLGQPPELTLLSVPLPEVGLKLWM